jgi:hypothetical protein
MAMHGYQPTGGFAGAPPTTGSGVKPPSAKPDCYTLSTPHVTRDRYPDPAVAELVTMWRKDGRAVLSVTSAGATQDFFIASNVVGLLARECVELLEHSTNLKG